MPEFRYCASCDSSHMAPVPCGMNYRDRLRSQRLDYAAMETRDLKNYYDADALPWDGDEAEAQMLEDTKGLGYAQTVGDEVYHRNYKTGEIEAMNDKQLDLMLGSDTEVDL